MRLEGYGEYSGLGARAGGINVAGGGGGWELGLRYVEVEGVGHGDSEGSMMGPGV